VKVLGGERGPWRCHYAGECSRVCPKGVDPAKAIQIMKRELVLDYLRLRRPHRPSPVVPPPKEPQRQPGIPDAPPRSV
jgi:succinate dehydrogenase / fumarate reductase iron-sulfur subunit